MRPYRKYIVPLVLILLCAIATATSFAQQPQSPQAQWNQLAATGEIQPLEGSQTVGNTTITVLGGYADSRVMMINYRVSGNMPPLPIVEHTFITDSGTPLAAFGSFSVTDGEVVLFRNPDSTTGTLQSRVVSARFGYNSQTGETLQGDGTIIGPFNNPLSLTQNTQTTGSGSGVQTTSDVTMTLQQFYVTPSGATAVVCHNQTGYTIESAALTNANATLSMSSASMPSTDNTGQTCQSIGFINIQPLGNTAVLRIEQILDPSPYGEYDPLRQAQEQAALLRERGYNATVERLPMNGTRIVGTGPVPEEVLDEIRAEMGNAINGNWSFNVTLN